MGEGYGTSCIVEFGHERIMVDCGPGTTYKMARMGMLPTQINTVFLTHHHSDHIVDFPCFALLRFDLDPGDLAPLKVYGPPPTVAFTDRLFGNSGAFRPDIVARQEHPVSHHGHVERGGTLPRPGIKVDAQDVVSGETIHGDGWIVTAVEVPHIEPYLMTLAYRMDTKEHSILFLCDAAECRELRELAKGVDTLVTGMVGHNLKGEDASHPIHGVSADASEIMDITADSGIGRVVLIHNSPSEAYSVAKLRQGYAGKAFQGFVVRPDEMTSLEL